VARRIHAKRYAQAVFAIALEARELDRWQADLRKIADLSEDATFAAWLQSPKVHFSDKAKLLPERLPEINPLVLNLVYLLVARGRLAMIADIANEYQRLLDSYRGIGQAEVTTAIPLDEEDEQKLAERLGAVVGIKVVLKPGVDLGIIGGVVARVGDKLLDASTRSKLEALRTELAGMER
jgi:F-type H+-transporting ATPase subunit delta